MIRHLVTASILAALAVVADIAYPREVSQPETIVSDAPVSLPDLTITSTGALDVTAPAVSLGPKLRVEEGGRLSVRQPEPEIVLTMRTAICGISSPGVVAVVVETDDDRKHRVNGGPWTIPTRRSWHSVVVDPSRAWTLDVDVDPGFNGVWTRFSHPLQPGMTGSPTGTPLCRN